MWTFIISSATSFVWIISNVMECCNQLYVFGEVVKAVPGKIRRKMLSWELGEKGGFDLSNKSRSSA